jgi:hypothetical protein
MIPEDDPLSRRFARRREPRADAVAIGKMILAALVGLGLVYGAYLVTERLAADEAALDRLVEAQRREATAGRPAMAPLPTKLPPPTAVMTYQPPPSAGPQPASRLYLHINPSDLYGDKYLIGGAPGFLRWCQEQRDCAARLPRK